MRWSEHTRRKPSSVQSAVVGSGDSVARTLDLLKSLKQENHVSTYLVAKKTWQVSVACDEMRYIQDHDSLSYLLFDNQEEAEEQ